MDSQDHEAEPESRGAAKRRRLFERAVEAHARATGRTDGKFVCPVCLDSFDSTALERDLLSLEHVPPRSVGGKELCLTCRRCNSEAGDQFDYAVAEAERYRAMQSGLKGQQTDFSTKVIIEAEGRQLNAGLRFDENGVVIEVHERRNNPVPFAAQIDALRQRAGAGDPEMTFRLDVSFRFSPRKLFVSWLRAAYLAAFAKFGYDYVLRKVLDPVRLQILHPEEQLVPNSALAFDARHTAKLDGPNILHMRAPLEGLMVYFPAGTVANGTPLMVMLPMPDSPQDFYSNLAASYVAVEGQRRIDTTGGALGWPNGAEFLADFAGD